jgi:diguanylate cyclase (GGDEF)-like protein
MRRPGVSGRVLGTMLLPLLLLSIVSVSVTADRHDDAVVAERITRTAGELESLVALRSAMLAERLAEEVTLTGRRPPKELARSSEFLNEVLDHPERVLVRTDDALDSVPDDLRPFDADDLAGVRTDRPPAGDSTALIAERWEPLQTALLEQMERSLRLIRMDAVLLGDLELAGATDDLDAAIAAPTRSAELLGLLTELWLAPRAERLELQAQLAAEDARFGAVVDQLARSAEPSVRALWRAQGEMPEAVAASMDIARRGVLGDPAREVGFPNEVWLSLLEGIDWAGSRDDPPALRSLVPHDGDQGWVARQAERTTALLTLVAVAASIGAALLFGRSIVAPVRRLTDQATSVGRGDLGVEPLALSGPPEVVRASAAFNDVVDNLVLLERKTRALADCDFEDTSLAQPLPGMLGASLQRSVKVLSGSIIERQQLQQRLVHQATHDALTGLANRAELVSTLTEAHQHRRRAGDAGTQVAVVFIDLDGFKRANDRYGHAVGDELLRVVARRLQSEVRREVLVARLGGDEFVVVMPAVADWHEPVALARRLVRTISEPVEVEGHWVRVGASAGVALSGTSRGDADALDLLRCADLAVYTAKQRTGDPVAVYDDEMDQMVVDQEDIEEGLAEALHRPGELSLVYQPVLDSLTGDPVGVEALVRWDRPECGAVSPAVFVPIAERSGLVVDLDLWVLETALVQLRDWSTRPLTSRLGLAVNVSGRSLLDPGFVEQFCAVLGEAAVDPHRLTIEVTETALVTDLDLAASQLEQLRSLGVRVAIDDFGTGYTSVAHLRALPVDEIKIDSSFVHGLPDRESYILIQMINELAHRLDVPTVAEGVETADQVDALREIGCDCLQGFLFARPMPAADLLSWMAPSAAPESAAPDAPAARPGSVGRGTARPPTARTTSIADRRRRRSTSGRATGMATRSDCSTTRTDCSAPPPTAT